jgi:NAD(P)-dependent dehydrogenase (short-subunit alcohol dehydrogenase family)
MNPTNRIALVTGANKGIGLEIARQLAQAGVSVIIGARDAERGQAALADLSAQGFDATLVQIDLLDEAEHRRCRREALGATRSSRHSGQ